MRILISSTAVYYPFRDASCRFAKTHLRKVDRSQESDLIFVLMQHFEMHGVGRCTSQKRNITRLKIHYIHYRQTIWETTLKIADFREEGEAKLLIN